MNNLLTLVFIVLILGGIVLICCTPNRNNARKIRGCRCTENGGECNCSESSEGCGCSHSSERNKSKMSSQVKDYHSKDEKFSESHDIGTPAFPNNQYKGDYTKSEFRLMTQLWGFHVYFFYKIILYTMQDKDPKEYLNGVMINAEEISDIIGKHYGEEAKQKFLDLFKEHIGLLGDILGKAKNSETYTDLESNLYKNADKISEYLSNLTNGNINYKNFKESFYIHNGQDLDLVNDFINKDYKKAITDYNTAKKHSEKMGQDIWYGIIKDNHDSE